MLESGNGVDVQLGHPACRSEPISAVTLRCSVLPNKTIASCLKLALLLMVRLEQPMFSSDPLLLVEVRCCVLPNRSGSSCLESGNGVHVQLGHPSCRSEPVSARQASAQCASQQDSINMFDVGIAADDASMGQLGSQFCLSISGSVCCQATQDHHDGRWEWCCCASWASRLQAGALLCPPMFGSMRFQAGQYDHL